jgi:release factor glutamine methyltransferase
VVDLTPRADGVEMLFSPAPASLRTCLARVTDVLDKAEIDGYDVEARLLCEWATGRDRVEFVTNPDALVSSPTIVSLQNALALRLTGMPVHRIIGHRDFYGLRLKLSSETLEPRPDTETLVDQVLDIIKKNSTTESPLRILDLGTGTGAIALALLSKLPNAHALAVDISAQAIETAQQNAEDNALSQRFDTLQSNWFENVSGSFDVIVSNPPYIRSPIIDDLDKEVRDHDPLIALDGGADGLYPYREIARNAHRFLAQNGFVGVEIGYDQASDIKDIFSSSGFDLMELRKDLGRRDRAMAFALKVT